MLCLQEYGFLVVHKYGRKHTDAGGLSRTQLPPAETVLPESLTTAIPDADVLPTIYVDFFIEAQ